ncbi:MAG: peptide-methionine (S)-S-oxide reductase [Desulfohalobiaceae bacterium]|nr:peptide-methionine (S)-S-oxide reductase [Desulfohalobiaceae bacterium]
MVRTRVGYAGGTKENPTYRNLGDHSETIQVDYDPEVITYEELLKIFWENHNPEFAAWSRQYMAAVFYHDEEQKRAAEKSRERLASKLNREIKTQILPFTGFYLAEDYHQKYTLSRYPELMKEFRAMYPTTQGLVSSTSAARVNGYLAGYGGCERLQTDINALGLSEQSAKRLLTMVCGRKVAATCNIKEQLSLE